MSRSWNFVVVLGCLALLASLGLAWNAVRELESQRRELLKLTDANEFLKKTLGDMTIALAAKDKEIDRLQHSACAGQEKAPPLPVKPNRNKVSDSHGVRAGDNQGLAPAEGGAK